MEPSEAADAPLDPREIEQATALVAEVGWNQVAADWEIFLAAGRVRAVRDAGRVVATAATLPYQGFGWISMVLVAPSHRRRGLASRLLRRCIDDLTGGGLVPALDATPAGRELYRQLGFTESWGIARMVARERSRPLAAAVPGLEVRPMRDADWPTLRARDQVVFGADRGIVLAQLRRRLPSAAWVAISDDRLAGYLLGRDGRTAAHLGPLVADSDEVATALLARALDAVSGPIYIDLRAARSALRAWLEKAGFTLERNLTRMYLGHAAGFGDPGPIAAIAGPELG